MPSAPEWPKYITELLLLPLLFLFYTLLLLSPFIHISKKNRKSALHFNSATTCHQWLPGPPILPSDRHCTRYKIVYCIVLINDGTPVLNWVVCEWIDQSGNWPVCELTSLGTDQSWNWPVWEKTSVGKDQSGNSLVWESTSLRSTSLGTDHSGNRSTHEMKVHTLTSSENEQELSVYKVVWLQTVW